MHDVGLRDHTRKDAPVREQNMAQVLESGQLGTSDAWEGTYELLEGGYDQLERHLWAHLEYCILEHLRQVNQVGLSRRVSRGERTPPSLTRREVLCNKRVYPRPDRQSKPVGQFVHTHRAQPSSSLWSRTPRACPHRELGTHGTYTSARADRRL